MIPKENDTKTWNLSEGVRGTCRGWQHPDPGERDWVCRGGSVKGELDVLLWGGAVSAGGAGEAPCKGFNKEVHVQQR